MPKESLIEEAVSLLNRNELSEALKVLRKYHGIVCKWICTECKVITSGIEVGRCLYCSNEKHETIIVHEQAKEAK